MTDKENELLKLAHNAILWADQCWQGIEGQAGGKWYKEVRDSYFKARMKMINDNGDALETSDCGPFYYEGAQLQPWNHRIPWNCPTYWNGCNCEGGPFYNSSK